jgi:hypothetical protein
MLPMQSSDRHRRLRLENFLECRRYCPSAAAIGPSLRTHRAAADSRSPRDCCSDASAASRAAGQPIRWRQAGSNCSFHGCWPAWLTNPIALNGVLVPREIFVLSCDSRSAARPADLSYRRKGMALLARDSGSDAGSMDAEAVYRPQQSIATRRIEPFGCPVRCR